MASLKNEMPPHGTNQRQFGATNEIADVLLDKGVKKATVRNAGADEEEIYDLVVEEATTDYRQEIAILSNQVEHLSREQEALHLQLKNALIASNNLTKQLAKAKKGRASSHLALLVAGLALVAVAALATIGWEMQLKLTDVMANADRQGEAAKQVTVRLNDVDDKVTKIFEAENSDNLLQITRALKAQVGALADRTLATAAPVNESGQQVAAMPAANSLAAKHQPEHKGQVDKKEAVSTAENKVKPDGVKKATPDKSNEKAPDNAEPVKKVALVKTKDNAEKKGTAKSNWVIGLGSYRDKDTAKRRLESFKKAGASVELIEVKTKNRLLYRIVAKTTKTKQEAENYAERIKRTLKLDSVSMNKN
jgi:hypothetical protein